MKARVLLHALCLAGFAAGGFPAPAPASHVMWTEICGRPGQRVPIEIPGRRPGEPCAKACHAAVCRRTAADSGLPDGDDGDD